MPSTVITVTIGTAADCDIRVADEYASAHHCRVFSDRSEQVWVMDLGSTNGTRVVRAGVPVPTDPIGLALVGAKVTVPARLYPGDMLIVGRTPIPWSPRRAPIRVEAVVEDA